MDSDDDLLQIFHPGEELSRLDLELLIVARETSRLSTAVRGLELVRDYRRGEAIGGQPLRIQNHSYLAGLPSDDRGFRNIIQLLERVFQFTRDAAQMVRVVVFAPERERHDGDIIDRAALDNRLRNSRRDAIEVGVELVVGLDDGVFFLRAHIEAHDQHAHARLADGIDIFDTRHFAQQLLHGEADPLRNFFRGCARHLHEYVEHGDNDLRFFLARRLQDAESTQQQCSDDHQRSQLRIDEAASDASRQAKAGRGLLSRVSRFVSHGHHWASMRLPLRSSTPGCATKRSPSWRPASTST